MALLLAFYLAGCTSTPALVIPGINGSVGDLSTQPNDEASAARIGGLTAQVYLRGIDRSSAAPPSADDIAQEMTWAQPRTCDFNFVDSAINDNSGINMQGYDYSPVGTFFSPYGKGPITAVTTDLNSTVANWFGYVRVPTPGEYNVILVADDGGAVYLFGTENTWGSGTLVAQSNYEGTLNTQGQNLVNFSRSGDYPIQIFWYNQILPLSNGGAGLAFQVVGPGKVTFWHDPP